MDIQLEAKLLAEKLIDRHIGSSLGVREKELIPDIHKAMERVRKEAYVAGYEHAASLVQKVFDSKQPTDDDTDR